MGVNPCLSGQFTLGPGSMGLLIVPYDNLMYYNRLSASPDVGRGFLAFEACAHQGQARDPSYLLGFPTIQATTLNEIKGKNAWL